MKRTPAAITTDVLNPTIKLSTVARIRLRLLNPAVAYLVGVALSIFVVTAGQIGGAR